jgi:hypothetical protein
MTTPIEPETGIKVHITDNFQFDGISVYMGVSYGYQSRTLLHFHEDGHAEYEHIDQPVSTNPSIVLTNDFGRALLDALLRYYQGASDMHTIRSDYLHERGRVDKMIDNLMYRSANTER